MVSERRRNNLEYYAVVTGRLDEPAIFSSWGDAHPRVTGCKAEFKGFVSIQEARDYMERKGFAGWKEIIKDTALETTPARNSMAYYAVAHGANPGIRDFWYGPEGASQAVHEISGACHKHFRTKEQAEAFIEDWKETYAEVWRRAVKEALDNGLRPLGMKLDTKEILRGANQDPAINGISQRFDSVMSFT
ncbi:uncharacterized protein K460DRAFT_412268 [Cucurbitaria berberidis CBS 394.84]|uniref:Ribonuclease H1 N-terminal domain-containing protein n=1 Tax=Cucurbitaria berberidis CBS 394.84 TaxID=1168544 RepID=A0A9P4LCC8_9PLEO|nr:uncharacterized protein K460DRAFT_412268 [Cucurbitaria berberidis CBS 394.84]KAF1850581.1 hypothetical protein K460DRAFT_412268 [Cucurbitaria berberidis CBS 394.84]